MEEHVQTMLFDDPRRAELERQGWMLVGESWGARLRLADPLDVSSFVDAVTSVIPSAPVAPSVVSPERPDESGRIEIRELASGDTVEIVELEDATHPDYPDTPASRQPRRTAADVHAMRESGTRFFGALEDGRLVAVTAVTRQVDYAETEFTSVRAEARRRGFARAVKAASILALTADGVRTFGTGGAQVNAASIGMNESLGYVVEERWVSLAPPPALV